MAQGGDPSGTGYGWPGYRCDDEIDPSRTFAAAGVVAMANSGADTNGGQFFITYGPTAHLDGGYTIIGEVISGQETIDTLTPRDPEQNPTFSGDKIVTIEVTEQ
jgi:peptidylprolyl isomerase/peptidyl-prolyl cis-trans isomerase B (cyclophilin B)